jgi:hypothetical protein
MILKVVLILMALIMILVVSRTGCPYSYNTLLYHQSLIRSAYDKVGLTYKGGIYE